MSDLLGLPCCPYCSVRTGGEGQVFGVRSYLHLFYEECAFARPEEEEAEEEGKEEELNQMSWPSLVWKVGLAVGLFLSVMGVGILLVGLLLPPRIEGFGEGDLSLVDVHAVGHNSLLGACRLAGGLLLALGASVLLACGLAWPVAQATDQTHVSEQGGQTQGSPTLTANVSPIHSMLPVSVSETFSIQP